MTRTKDRARVYPIYWSSNKILALANMGSTTGIGECGNALFSLAVKVKLRFTPDAMRQHFFAAAGWMRP
jgi:hypothetical protein